jgi:FtsP/CotA-like multicopper oxidase with cupredoxin domain
MTTHACEIQLAFPTHLQAQQVLQVLQVDQEPTDRVSKSFALVPEETCSMTVRFESKELKMLRVSVSSFYDYLIVVLKTLQEFDATTKMK